MKYKLIRKYTLVKIILLTATSLAYATPDTTLHISETSTPFDGFGINLSRNVSWSGPSDSDMYRHNAELINGLSTSNIRYGADRFYDDGEFYTAATGSRPQFGQPDLDALISDAILHKTAITFICPMVGQPGVNIQWQSSPSYPDNPSSMSGDNAWWEEVKFLTFRCRDVVDYAYTTKNLPLNQIRVEIDNETSQHSETYYARMFPPDLADSAAWSTVLTNIGSGNCLDNGSETKVDRANYVKEKYLLTNKYYAGSSCFVSGADDAAYLVDRMIPSRAYANAAYYLASVFRDTISSSIKIAATGSQNRIGYTSSYPASHRMRRSDWDKVLIIGLEDLEATMLGEANEDDQIDMIDAVTDHRYDYSVETHAITPDNFFYWPSNNTAAQNISLWNSQQLPMMKYGPGCTALSSSPCPKNLTGIFARDIIRKHAIVNTGRTTGYDASSWFKETWFTEFNFDQYDITNNVLHESSWAKALAITFEASELIGLNNARSADFFVSTWLWTNSYYIITTGNMKYTSTGYLLELLYKASYLATSKSRLSFDDNPSLDDSDVVGTALSGEPTGALDSLYGWEFSNGNSNQNKYVIINMSESSLSIDISDIDGAQKIVLQYSPKRPTTTFSVLGQSVDQTSSNADYNDNPLAWAWTEIPLGPSIEDDEITIAPYSVLLIEIDDDANDIADSMDIDTDDDSDLDSVDVDDDDDGICDDGSAVLGVCTAGPDNCPLVSNSTQTDTDSDDIGDSCDADDDNDYVHDVADAFPTNSSENNDNDNDSYGDNSDTDDDNDGICDGSSAVLGVCTAGPDNCPLVSNSTQTDTDSDDIGDNCETDDDNDLIFDERDNCILVNNPNQVDSIVSGEEPDGYGNACDGDLNNDGDVDVIDMRLLISQGFGSWTNQKIFGISMAAPHINRDISDIDQKTWYEWHNQSSYTPGPSGLSCAGDYPCPEQ